RERLADRPLHLVPGYGLPDLPSDRKAEPGAVARTVLTAGEGVEDEKAVAARVPLPVDAVEVAAPGEAAPTRIGAAVRRQRLRSEPLAALLPPAAQDRAARAGSAPRPESVGPGSLALLRLVGPLHRQSPPRG